MSIHTENTRKASIGRGRAARLCSCLLLAAGLLWNAVTPAEAIEFKAKGVWLASFQYGQNGNFTGSGHSGYDPSEDEFEARSRVRVILDAVASENVSGQVYFEIGKFIWGKARSGQNGGALGADDTIVKVKRAFIDWMIPETDIKVRMGIQGIGLPYAAMDGPTVFQSDVAAVSANWTINENVGVTAFWARPYNDNYSESDGSGSNFMDNMDMAALTIPLRFDGLKMTPWFMYAAIGPNTWRVDDSGNYVGKGINGVNGKYVRSGMLSLAANLSDVKTRKLSSYANAWWAGLAGELTMWSPWRLAWEFTYGQVEYDVEELNREGWMGALTLEYKMDWGTAGIFGWYSSGDDDDLSNGSERMPTVSNDYGVCSFSGTFVGPDINGLERDRVIGNNLVGTWGVGFRLKNMSFFENLKHTFHVSLLGGTNDPGILEAYHDASGTWMTPNSPDGQGTFLGRENMYLTTNDYALEVGLLNTYKIYENFQVNVEANYVKLWLDRDDNVWGNALGSQSIKDAWNVSTLFIYSF